MMAYRYLACYLGAKEGGTFVTTYYSADFVEAMEIVYLFGLAVFLFQVLKAGAKGVLTGQWNGKASSSSDDDDDEGDDSRRGSRVQPAMGRFQMRRF